MKTRPALLVAILTGLAAIGLNLFVVANKATRLHAKLREESALRLNAETTLATANQKLERVNAALQETTAALQTTADANKSLVARVAEQNSHAIRLTAKVDSAQQALADTKANLAAYESVMTIQQAVTASREIKSLHAELASIKAHNAELTNVVAQQEAELNFKRGRIVYLPATLYGKVLAADPKWQFVVLNAGERQGVLKHGELLVSRGGRLVGKVIVKRVDKESSIANVMPRWNLTEIMEGDALIPAYPRS